jgi:hypothetical protein
MVLIASDARTAFWAIGDSLICFFSVFLPELLAFLSD